MSCKCIKCILLKFSLAWQAELTVRQKNTPIKLSSPYYTARFFSSVVGFPNMRSDIVAKPLYLYLYVLNWIGCLALYSGLKCSAFMQIMKGLKEPHEKAAHLRCSD